MPNASYLGSFASLDTMEPSTNNRPSCNFQEAFLPLYSFPIARAPIGMPSSFANDDLETSRMHRPPNSQMSVPSDAASWLHGYRVENREENPAFRPFTNAYAGHEQHWENGYYRASQTLRPSTNADAGYQQYPGYVVPNTDDVPEFSANDLVGQQQQQVQPQLQADGVSVRNSILETSTDSHADYEQHRRIEIPVEIDISETSADAHYDFWDKDSMEEQVLEPSSNANPNQGLGLVTTTPPQPTLDVQETSPQTSSSQEVLVDTPPTSDLSTPPDPFLPAPVTDVVLPRKVDADADANTNNIGPHLLSANTNTNTTTTQSPLIIASATTPTVASPAKPKPKRKPAPSKKRQTYDPFIVATRGTVQRGPTRKKRKDAKENRVEEVEMEVEVDEEEQDVELGTETEIGMGGKGKKRKVGEKGGE